MTTTTDGSAQQSSPPPARESNGNKRSRVILASTIGTTIEFYDFYAYATAAIVVFPHLFFPENENSTIGLLSSLATFGLAFVARPVGSVLFGHFGDRIGRKATLIGALLTMGIATFIIGCLPTYDQIGLWAPALLALMRFCQGIGLGGEWSGAALLATENAEEGKRARAAMWPQLGAPFGFLLANGVFLGLVMIMDHTTGDMEGDFLTWGWRVPFLLSAVMVIIGLYVRFKLDETPVFQETLDKGEDVKVPTVEVFRVAWQPVLLGTFVMVSTYTLFYLVTTWFLSYGIGDKEAGEGLGIPYNDFLVIQLIAALFFVVGIPIAGYLADTVGRRRFLTVVSVLILVYCCAFQLFLDPTTSGELKAGIFLSTGMFLMGLIFGPMSAVLPEMFPTKVRYTGSGISYNVASILGAAVAPFIAVALSTSYGPWAVGVYLGVVTLISLIAIRIMRETRDADLYSI
ncbi:MAG TPA: MHS family MFS transporter [Candidatus Corynebacterium avicola]|uniref:Putative proline/betaine transporter n=1 Tax=Candidatus Corynebacterium avicola TaxID=2838527 RepID=A0A9D1RQ52_9CORY|nr:MHS family MFS transporter [Candidatus Corynebacterium avicola]